MTYLDGLQTALAAEHAAVWVVGYLGAQTSESGDPRLYAALLDSYGAHRSRRDVLDGLVRAQDAEPVAAAPSYEVPDLSAAAGGDAVRARALRLEKDCGAAYGYLVASSPTEQRRFAVDALLDAARRELELGGPPRRYPGR